MKKLLLSFLPMLFALLAFNANAQDFSATVTWDKPGSIQVKKGSSPAYATPVEIADDATSFTVNEKEDYIFFPTEDYFIESATMNGANQSLTPDYSTGAKYFKLQAKYQSTKFNNQTVALKMAAYEVVGEFTLTIENGADKLTVQMQDAAGSLTQALTPVNGTTTYTIRNVDKQLYVKPAGYLVPALFTATNNGEAITQATNGSYTTPLAADAKIVLALNDPSTVEAPVEVKFVFTNNDPACISNIRNWSTSKFIDLEQFAADNYTLKLDKGTNLAINMNEDYTLNSITANPAVEVSGEIKSGTRFTIKEATTITIDATAIEYGTETATIYTNNIDGLTFATAFTDGETLTPEFVKENPEGSVTFTGRGKYSYTINIPTSEYTLPNIPGKTKKFFYSAKPGYWVKDGVLGNKAITPDDDDYHLRSGVMVKTEEAPVFFNVGKIDYSAQGIVFFNGLAGGTAKLDAFTDGLSGSMNAPYEGQPGVMSPGHVSTFKFDPEYNASFTAAMFITQQISGVGFYTYVDGVAQTASEDSEGVFKNLVLKNNSVVKMFYTNTPPATHTISFEVGEGTSATLNYDQIVTTTDFSKAIKNVGKVEYKFTPAEGTMIFVNEAKLEAPYIFTAEKDATVKFVADIKSETFPVTLVPADSAVVKKLDKVTIIVPVTAAMMEGTGSIYFEENVAEYVSVTKGTETFALSAIEPGEPSETGIPVVVYLESPITAEGEYTVSLAEGLVYTTVWDDAKGEFVRPAGASVNAAVTAKVTVDPNFQYKWSFTPENGSQNPLPGADDEYVFIYLSLPEADSLIDEPIDSEGAYGPWVRYNGNTLKRGTDEVDGDWMFIPDWDFWGQPVLRIAVNASVFNIPGDLSISAFEGAFTVNGNEASPELEYSAQFGEKKEFTYNFLPVAGSEVTREEITTIKLTIDGADKVEIGELYAIFGQGWSYGIELNESCVSIEGNVVTFTIPESFSPKYGNNSLTIGEQSFLIDGMYYSPDLVGSWNVIRTTPIDFTWVAQPGGTIINYGYGLEAQIMFGEEETVRVIDRTGLTVTFNGEKLGGIDYDNYDTVAGYAIGSSGDYPNAILLSVGGGMFNSKDTTGKLTLTIPAGGVSVSGEVLDEAIEYTWNVIKEKDYVVEVSPADGETVKTINKITVKFTNADTAELFNLASISLRKNDYSYNSTPQEVKAVEGAECPTFEITFGEELTVAGPYTFTMRTGAFTLDGVQDSPAVTAVITVDPDFMGVDGIFGDAANGKLTVVNLQGIVLMQDATAEDLKQLPAGIYIINGKKVALK